LALLGVAACQHYVPATVNDLERMNRVRVRLSEPLEVELMDLTANNATLLDGEVVRWDDESLILSVWWVEAMGGLEFRGVGETVEVPRDQIAELEERKISVFQTVGLAALLVAGMVLIGSAFSGAGSSGEDGEDPPPQ
jgi:hypothetical protein